MSLEQTACEDLKAFERRLTEVVSCARPAATRWRVILLVVSMFTAIFAYYWLSDPHTSMVSFLESLMNHPFFALSSVALGFLFLTGVHKRVMAPSILTSRTRQVLTDFNMSCDDTGKLILRPRPVPT